MEGFIFILIAIYLWMLSDEINILSSEVEELLDENKKGIGKWNLKSKNKEFKDIINSIISSRGHKLPTKEDGDYKVIAYKLNYNLKKTLEGWVIKGKDNIICSYYNIEEGFPKFYNITVADLEK